jgi:hypothetical protein
VPSLTPELKAERNLEPSAGSDAGSPSFFSINFSQLGSESTNSHGVE